MLILIVYNKHKRCFIIPTVQVQIPPEKDNDVIDHKKRLKLTSKADMLSIALDEYLHNHKIDLSLFRSKEE